MYVCVVDKRERAAVQVWLVGSGVMNRGRVAVAQLRHSWAAIDVDDRAGEAGAHAERRRDVPGQYNILPLTSLLS